MAQWHEGADTGLAKVDPAPDQHADDDRSKHGLMGTEVGIHGTAEVTREKHGPEDGGLRREVENHAQGFEHADAADGGGREALGSAEHLHDRRGETELHRGAQKKSQGG